MKTKKELRKQLKQKPIKITNEERKRMKKEAVREATEIASLFDLWILRTKYGFGEKRLKSFIEHRKELVEAFEQGYITLKDIEKQLKEEANIQ